MPGRVVRFPSASRAEHIATGLITLGGMSDAKLAAAIEALIALAGVPEGEVELLDPALRGHGAAVPEQPAGPGEDPVVEGAVLLAKASEHVGGLRLLR